MNIKQERIFRQIKTNTYLNSTTQELNKMLKEITSMPEYYLVLDRLDAKDVYFIKNNEPKFVYLFTIHNNYVSYQYGTSDTADRMQLCWLNQLLKGEFKEELLGNEEI